MPSMTDPEAKLYKTSAWTPSMRAYLGHAVCEKRSGLIVTRAGEAGQRHWQALRRD